MRQDGVSMKRYSPLRTTTRRQPRAKYYAPTWKRWTQFQRGSETGGYTLNFLHKEL